MSETIPEARELAERIISTVEGCGCDDCLDAATEIITRALLARDERAAKEEREAASDYVEGVAAQFDHLAACGGRKSKWNEVLAANFHSIASAIRDRSKT